MKKLKQSSLPWKIWLLWLPFAVLAVIAFVILDSSSKIPAPTFWIAVLLGLSPLITTQIALGSPKAMEQLHLWTIHSGKPVPIFAIGISLVFLLSGLAIGQFEPYAAVIFICGTFTVFGTLSQIKQPGLTWADGAIWLLIWIPFDLRWSNQLWFGPDGFSYTWWAFAVSVIAILSWGTLRQLPGFGYRLTPRWKDITIALAGLIPIFVIAVPIGVATGFLQYSPPVAIKPLETLAYFIGIFLTIAIPEELFFRAILQTGLESRFKKEWLGWMLASIAFGLMHWNNASTLSEKLIYCSLASVAGFFYGWTYKKSGNNILAPVLTHTLVDLIWKIFLQ